MVDNIGPPPADIVAIADAMAPFPPAPNNYPGHRRIIAEGDVAAFAYVRALLEAASPYLAGAFDLDHFALVEASFSLVTTPADRLTPVQCAPHFDGPDADLLAVLHYLSPTEGTAFFRHRDSGIERVSADWLDAYVAAMQRKTPHPGYVFGSTATHEEIGRVEGLVGRLVAYPVNLLHSGLIPPGFAGSVRPSEGRLTCNMFLRIRSASVG